MAQRLQERSDDPPDLVLVPADPGGLHIEACSRVESTQQSLRLFGRTQIDEDPGIPVALEARGAIRPLAAAADIQ